MPHQDEELAALFHACRLYQREVSTDSKPLADRIFLDRVRDFHEKAGKMDHYDSIPDDSTYCRHRNNPPRRARNECYPEALAMFLEQEGYWPVDSTTTDASAALCAFFGVNPQSRSSRVLRELVGQYRCFQRSSWYPGYVQLSTISFSKAGGEDAAHLNVSENQATGSSIADEIGVIETVENFDGIAFARQNMVFLTLREERLKTPKFCLIYGILPDQDERPAIHLQGYTLKGSNGPRARLHLSRLIMERLGDQEENQPRQISRDEFGRLFPRYYKRLFEVPLNDF